MGDLTITDSIIRLHEGRPSPFARIDGRWYWIETKPSLIELGLATAIPMTNEWQEDWSAQPRLSAILPQSAERPEPQDMEDTTDDPQVVALALRFNELAAAGAAEPGQLTLA